MQNMHCFFNVIDVWPTKLQHVNAFIAMSRPLEKSNPLMHLHVETHVPGSQSNMKPP